MRVVAYKTETNTGSGGVIIEESGGEHIESDSLDALFSFLLEPLGRSLWPPQYDACVRVCWELDATVAPLLKLLGEERCRRLHESHKCYCAPFNLFYVSGKVFSVVHIPTKARTSLYDLAQYFPDFDEPGSVDEVQMLGEYLLRELRKMGLEPGKLTSPVAIYEECVMNYLDLPFVGDMPREAAEYAWYCSGQLWVEAYQVGYWEEAFDYDIIGSFPAVVVDLVDFRRCKWVNSEDYQEEAVYGYCRGVVTIFDNIQVSPIMYIDDKGNLSTRTGTWPTYLTKEQMDFINKWQIGEFRIENGWWAIPTREGMAKPLEVPIKRLLEYKQRTGLQSVLAKRMSVGVYGKLGEVREDTFGPHFNPVWFAEIATRVGLQVAEFIYRHKLETALVHVGVDGVLLDRDAGIRRKDLAGIDRQWKLSYCGPALVVSSGLVFYAEKMPKGLRLGDVMGMIREHPRMGYYERKIVRRVTLGDAVGRGRLEELGDEKEMFSSIDLYLQRQDRDFRRLPRTGQALVGRHYGSRPLPAIAGD